LENLFSNILLILEDQYLLTVKSQQEGWITSAGFISLLETVYKMICGNKYKSSLLPMQNEFSFCELFIKKGE